MGKILVETSARHLHVTEEDLKILFGPEAHLSVKKDLSQPGQFASNEKVEIVGPKRSIPNVSILGPVRPKTQVEISATDARSIGIDIVIRESGDIANTPGCKIVGPAGEVILKEGVIVAKRHIHVTPEQAKDLQITDKEIVGVEIKNSFRSIIFNDVVVRVSPKFDGAMHIDTDESNAGMVDPNTYGKIIKKTK